MEALGEVDLVVAQVAEEGREVEGAQAGAAARVEAEDLEAAQWEVQEVVDLVVVRVLGARADKSLEAQRRERQTPERVATCRKPSGFSSSPSCLRCSELSIFESRRFLGLAYGNTCIKRGFRGKNPHARGSNIFIHDRLLCAETSVE